MTMTISKMSAGKGYEYFLRTVAAGDGDRSLSTPLTRYYTEDGTPPGRWMGSGIASLESHITVGDEVTEEQLRLLIGQAKHPVTGQDLGRRYRTCKVPEEGKRRHPVAGYDLTFSIPKPASVLWGASDAGTQAIIADAHHAAVAETIDFLEREVIATRGGAKGPRGCVAQLDVAGVVAPAIRKSSPSSCLPRSEQRSTSALLVCRGALPRRRSECLLGKKLDDEVLVAPGPVVHQCVPPGAPSRRVHIVPVDEVDLGVDVSSDSPIRVHVLDVCGEYSHGHVGMFVLVRPPVLTGLELHRPDADPIVLVQESCSDVRGALRFHGCTPLRLRIPPPVAAAVGRTICNRLRNTQAPLWIQPPLRRRAVRRGRLTFSPRGD